MNLFKKKQLTPAEQEEKRMMDTYGLRKDPSVKFQYWIDDIHWVSFIPGDKESIGAAEKLLQEHYRNPTMVEATPEQIAAMKQNKSGNGLAGIATGINKTMDELGKAMEPLRPMAEAGNQMGRMGDGVVSRASKSTGGRIGISGDEALGNASRAVDSSLGLTHSISSDDALRGFGFSGPGKTAKRSR